MALDCVEGQQCRLPLLDRDLVLYPLGECCGGLPGICALMAPWDSRHPQVSSPSWSGRAVLTQTDHTADSPSGLPC